MSKFMDGKKGDEGSESERIYDPTDPNMLRTNSGCEIPPPLPFSWIEGATHANAEDLQPFLEQENSGAIMLPASIILFNKDTKQPLSRDALYGVDLVLQSDQRSMHTMVFGVTGAGKNVNVLDNLRYSAINDPKQSVVSFSLKASDYGPISEMCDNAGKRLVVLNLDDASRSLGWNPLQTSESETAFDHIRRFADAMKNPRANETEFWNQWIKTAFMGVWQGGHKSFPAIYQFFSLPRGAQIEELRKHNNPASQQLADFLVGGSHNADTVAASIVGALTPFLMDSVQRVMGNDELQLGRLFEEPVCVHVEIREPKLETQKTLYQLLARAITDELIATAERFGSDTIPATVFFDDMPSLGNLLSPQRLLTLRSREIGVVAGVQSIASLELAYHDTTRALIDNFNNKIVLPGGPAHEAAQFSVWSGEHFVALTNKYGDETSYMMRPLLSASAIRSPACSHPLLGKPATLFLGAVVFQAYLQKSYELPSVGPAILKGRARKGNEKLRDKPLPMPGNSSHVVVTKPSSVQGPAVVALPKAKPPSAAKRRRDEKLKLEKLKRQIGWQDVVDVSIAARKWWLEIESEHHRKKGELIKFAEEIAAHNGTIWEYYDAMLQSPVNDRKAVLLLMAYNVILKRSKLDKLSKEQRLRDLEDVELVLVDRDEMPLFSSLPDGASEALLAGDDEFRDEHVYESDESSDSLDEDRDSEF